MQTMRIDQLYCYPVKSLKGIALTQAQVHELNTQPHLKGAYFGQNATLSAGAVQMLRIGDTLHAVWL